MKATYGTGVFVLAHVGRASARRRRAACCRRSPGGWTGEVEYALDGGVFTAGALLEWLSRDLGLAPDPPALAALAAEVEDAGGVRVLPGARRASARRGGGPRRAAVIAGLTGRTRAPATSRAPRSRRSRGAWPTSSAVVSEHVEPETLRVDGGLTRDPLLLRLQADCAGVPVERGAVDATAAGAAALAAVGAGLWPSTREIAERIPVGEPLRAPARRRLARRAAHAEWREFVERAAEL